MRALLLILLAPLCCRGQFVVTFTPLPAQMTQRIFANGKDVDIYQVAVCPEDSTPRAIPRERILAAAPQIPVILNAIAEDLLQRKADASTWSVLKRVGGLAVQYVPLGLTAYGLATGTPNLAKIGFSSSLGLDVLKLAATRVADRAPDPARYFAMLLPDAVVLNGNCQTFLAAAGAVASPAVIGPLHIAQPDSPVRIGAPAVIQ